MQPRRGWMSMRFTCRLGRRRFMLTFPPTMNRWHLLIAAVILVPIGYVLSAVPTVMALRKSGVYSSSVEACVMLFYAPLVWLEQNSPICRAFFEVEHRLIAMIFGD